MSAQDFQESYPLAIPRTKHLLKVVLIHGVTLILVQNVNYQFNSLAME